jgi:hypothetical protein
VYFVRRLSKLDPKYNCVGCELPQRKRAPLRLASRGECPGCPITDQKKWLSRQFEVEVKRKYGASALAEWPFEKIRALHRYVNRMLIENEDRIDKRWDRRTAQLARALQQEKDIVSQWDAAAAKDK